MQNIKQIEDYFERPLPMAWVNYVVNLRSELTGQVYIYMLPDVIERNECFEVKKYAPGFINIGNDGGGRAFIIKLGESDPAVLCVDHGSMDPEYSELIYSSFSEWVKADFCLV
jgi:hypothetical protein